MQNLRAEIDRIEGKEGAWRKYHFSGTFSPGKSWRDQRIAAIKIEKKKVVAYLWGVSTKDSTWVYDILFQDPDVVLLETSEVETTGFSKLIRYAFELMAKLGIMPSEEMVDIARYMKEEEFGINTSRSVGIGRSWRGLAGTGAVFNLRHPSVYKLRTLGEMVSAMMGKPYVCAVIEGVQYSDGKTRFSSEVKVELAEVEGEFNGSN